MFINTLHFGDIEVPDENILCFPDGIPGFEDIQYFAQITEQFEDGVMMWLQAVGSLKPCFVIFDPYMFVNDFCPVVSNSDLEELGAVSTDDLMFFVIAVIPSDFTEMTLNYKSPIAVNRHTNVARQVILDNSYPIRFKAFDNTPEGCVR